MTSARPSSRSDASASPSSSPARDRAGAQPRHHVAPPLPERSRERGLPVPGLVGQRSRRRAAADDRARVARGRARGAHASRRGPSARAGGRGRGAGAPIATRARSASRVRQPLAAHAFAHAADVDLDADRVGVVDLRGDRGRGVATDARAASVEVVGPAVVGDAARPPPTASAPAAGSRAGPTRRSPRPGPRPRSPRASGTARTNASNTCATRGTCVWCSITSETSTIQRSRVARQGRSWRPCSRYQRSSARVTASSSWDRRDVVGVAVVDGALNAPTVSTTVVWGSASTPGAGFWSTTLPSLRLRRGSASYTTDAWSLSLLNRCCASATVSPITLGTATCATPVETYTRDRAAGRDVVGAGGGIGADHGAGGHRAALGGHRLRGEAGVGEHHGRVRLREVQRRSGRSRRSTG